MVKQIPANGKFHPVGLPPKPAHQTPNPTPANNQPKTGPKPK
jgi:hypothetical protein